MRLCNRCERQLIKIMYIIGYGITCVIIKFPQLLDENVNKNLKKNFIASSFFDNKATLKLKVNFMSDVLMIVLLAGHKKVEVTTKASVKWWKQVIKTPEIVCIQK